MAVFFSYPLRLVEAEPNWPATFLARGAALSEALGREVRCGPEFGFDSPTLQAMPASWFTRLRHTLRCHGLPCTVHLPFWDLHPGSFDDNILAATRKTLSLALDCALRLEPGHCVAHPAYTKHVHQLNEQEFIRRSLDTWLPLVASLAGETTLLLENTHDESPRLLVELLTRLRETGPGAAVGLCFDVGHWYCFNGGVRKQDLSDWIAALAPWIRACHVHDNDGSADQHLAPGWGTIPFGRFFAGLSGHSLTPTIVLEAHGADAIQGAMQFLNTADGPWQAYF
ncbi:sugar phosphate isomerase/epimerase family protein [Megalodesulfovibrio paquesii]